MASEETQRKRRKSSFNPQWELDFLFMDTEKGPKCLCCQTVFSYKQFNLKRHFTTRHEADYKDYTGPDRERKVKELKEILIAQDKLDEEAASERAVKVSYHVAHELALKGRPFTDGEIIKTCMVRAATVLCPNETSKFEAVPLSRTTIARRTRELASDIEDQLRERAKKFVYFSVALDESTDVSNVAQLSIFVRGVDSNLVITEELLDLVPMYDSTTAEDVFSCLEETIENMNLNWEKMSSIATDGAPAMIGCRAGVVTRVKEKVRSTGVKEEIVGIHCFIHRENLCDKSIPLSNIMSVVTKVVNFLKAHALNHWQFKAFLEDIGSDYSEIPYYYDVRWLTRVKVLHRFFDLRDEIKFFMEVKQEPVIELENEKWVQDLAFFVDLTGHLNNLNTNLQGKKRLITELYDLVLGFQKKLDLWERQLLENNLVHFQNLKSLESKNLASVPFDEYVDVLRDLKLTFQDRFSDLARYENELNIFACPFSVDPFKMPVKYQLELTDLQSDRFVKDRFFATANLICFYQTFPKDRFPALFNQAAKVMSMLGTTYLCESAFSSMKLTKSLLRSALTDVNLKASLRLMRAMTHTQH